MEPLKRISRELKYKGAIIDIYQDKVQGPDGNVHNYDFIGHNVRYVNNFNCWNHKRNTVKTMARVKLVPFCHYEP